MYKWGMKNTDQTALSTEHVAVFENWSTEYSVEVRTKWFDTKKEADKQADKYRTQGADLSQVFTEKGSVLGKYRVAGHFYQKKQ